MFRFAIFAVSVLFIGQSVAQAGLYITPRVTVSADTTNPLATVTVDIIAGGWNGTSPASQIVANYTIGLDMVDVALVPSGTPIAGYTFLSVTSAASGPWSAMTGRTETYDQAGGFVSFSSGTNLADVTIPAVSFDTGGDAISPIFGTFQFTVSRPAVGSADNTYGFDLGPASTSWSANSMIPNASVDLFPFSSQFTIAAQTGGGAAVPEPASALLLAAGAAGFGWRRFRNR